MKEPLLVVRNLKKHFPLESSIPFVRNTQSVKAVDGVNFDLFQGETLGVVGESGCGKSTMARLINRLIEPTEGMIEFDNEDFLGIDKSALRAKRKRIQMIFQDPYASLDPRKTVEQLIGEPLLIHKIGNKKTRKQKVLELLEVVGLQKYHANRFPHEFSGGQRQRINIARALALNPDIVICDEPVSALDVSIQAQVINLLKKLQREFKLTYIFISHDLNVVRYMCDRIVVMYLGKIVEMGTAKEIYETPKHPYTRALLSAVPKENPHEEKERIILTGNVPSPINPPTGCHFHERCAFAMDVCKQISPNLLSTNKTQQVACHLYTKDYKKVEA